MGFQTYYSQKSLIVEGNRRIKEKDVISFDLFDTLLIRRVHDPDRVKLPVARFISSLADKNGIVIGWQNVQKLRDSIEQKQRAETGKKFDDHEACYPLFMRELLKTVFANQFSETILDEVTQYELLMENSMLVPRLQFFNWIKELKKQGKRIFIISDMYLPASHLKILVEHAGLSQFVEDVVSSADTFLAKASGKGYGHVQEKYSLQKERWLHIGDNSFSDGMRAVEFGIDALIIHDPLEDQRKSIVKRYINYSDGRPFWRGRALQQLMAPLEGENCERDALYNEGYNFLGPLVGCFVQEIAARCKKNSIGKIFFLSR
jgi:predicted HAD superfamily hydrolase